MLCYVLLENGHFIAGESAETPVPWWSFTKLVLAAAALVLVRDGRLALDESLSGQPFTLRQLLRHQAGVANYGSLTEYRAAVDARADAWPAQEMLERARADRLIFEPGEGWSYSNIGYFYVRRLIESTTRQNLEEALQALVLRPLGLSRPQLASSKLQLRDVRMGTGTDYDPRWVYHGLLVGPLEDAALLLSRLMRGDLLPSELMQSMQDRYWVAAGSPGEAWLDRGYGLGLMIETLDNGMRISGHTGAGPGSVVAIYHSQQFPKKTCAAFVEGGKQADVENFIAQVIKGVSPNAPE